MVSLERGGQQVGHRRAGGADHGDRHPRLSSDPERREARDALVDADVQAQRIAALEFGRHEGERLGA
nr:hypothetical protein GCM10025699_16060 [Microbacterium flavescens]